MIEIILMGIFMGGVYGIVGLGLSLIFAGIRHTMNVSHGQMVVLGSYLCFSVVTLLKLDPLLSLVIALPVIFCIGLALQYLLLNRVVLRDPSSRIQITLGIGLIVENTILLIYGPDSKSLAPYAQSYAGTYATVFGVNIPFMYLIDFIAAVIMMALIYFFMKYTYMGRAIRATSEDPVTVNFFGVNDKKIYAITFGIGVVLAALGGVFTGLTYAFEPSYGYIYLGMAFAVLILGGMGSIRGALVGGVIVGLIQALVSYYIGIAYAYLISNLVTLIVLALKPEGIFGYKV
jgi:branched-chain amino acid transport system permease protein